jgi:AcrR family transcriptional regulator
MARASAETKQETRARLLGAASEEFGRVGFERASIDGISVSAGFAKGTVYNYFASKEELFLAVVEEASRQTADSAAPPPNATARERLKATLASFCIWASEHDAFARVLVRECLMGTPGLYPRVLLAETPLVHRLQTILREGARSGELRDDQPAELLALALAGLADLALAQHWATGGSQLTIEAIPDIILGLLLGSPQTGTLGTPAIRKPSPATDEDGR